ncbi:putative ubiquitin-protein ligase UFD4 [Sporobolomyces koalae]|uniref:putative ubiquitin-protein ligase UFD4 n=1 Tax=Sporobolomyces koalae TaxID=500713 RepID=UPI00317F385D
MPRKARRSVPLTTSTATTNPDSITTTTTDTSPSTSTRGVINASTSATSPSSGNKSSTRSDASKHVTFDPPTGSPSSSTRSRRVIGSDPIQSSPTSSSSKAFGKRRAVSPSTTTTTTTDSSLSSKKQKLSHGSTSSETYNLRPRSSSTSNHHPHPTTSVSTTMPPSRKGTTRAGRAAKAKARAIEDEEDDEYAFEQAGYDNEVEMDQFDQERTSAGPSGTSHTKPREPMIELDKVQQSQVQERKQASQDPEDDHDNDDDDDDDDDDDNEGDDDENELHDDEDDDDDDEEIDEYDMSLGMNGEERDGDFFTEDDDEEEMLSGRSAPRTFNASGDPLSSDRDHDELERQAAMDEADALFGALAGAAARSGGGGGAGDLDDGGFGGAFQALRGMMTGMSNRLKTLLNSLKSTEGDSSAKLMALQELAELLSISTEDTLAGYFHTEAFSKELVAIVRGDSNGMGSRGGSGGGGGEGGMTKEEAIAFGLDPDEVCGGGAGGGDSEENDVQMMLLACRCLANLMEALPGSAHSVVYAGAVPVLCSKLQDIQYIELAEQTLSTLEKISEEVPSAIVREGGLSSLLTYLDFFSFHVQRTAVTAAANCCRSLSFDSFSMVKDAIPIFKNILGYPDQRVVEQACLAVVRIVDSYRHYPDKLEQLLTPDLLSAVKALLNPDSTTVGPSTYTQCLKALTTATKASPAVAINLVELDIGHTLYHLLTGVSPPEWTSDEGKQVLDRQTTQEDDMLVMQNLVQRPKEQVQETLNLVVELLPPLPKDGIFDPRAFLPGKSLKAGSKKETAESPALSIKSESTPETPARDQQSRPGVGGASASPDLAADVKMEAPSDEHVTPLAATPVLSRASSSHRSSRSSKPRTTMKDALVQKRLDLVSTDATPKRQLVVKRYFALLLPTLVDVYAASVSPQVRSKAVLGLLKIVQFCQETALADILHNVPFAAFIAAILSSHDQTQLITNALQLIELLLVKMPEAYQYTFRREGVMHEIAKIAALDLISQASSAKKQQQSSTTDSTDSVSKPNAVSLSPSERQAKDAITLRARHLRDEYGSADSEPAVRAKAALERIDFLVESLNRFALSQDKPTQIELEAKHVVDEIADLFSDAKNPLSSFEMLESGLVDGLLKFAVAQEGSLSPARRQEVLAKSFMPQLESKPASPAFGLLVKRLQESLSRMEEFQVVVAAQNANEADARRTGTTMLGRQLKLRLVAEDGQDIPRSCTNIVVSIHAIATFQAFNDYLRPRIVSALAAAERFGSGGGGGPGSSAGGTLSSLLAAFAAAAARADGDDPEVDEHDDEDPLEAEPEAEAEVETESGPVTDTPPPEPAASDALAAGAASSSAPKTTSPSRRRSSRLSGKGSDTEDKKPEAVAQGPEPAADADDQPMNDDFDRDEDPQRDVYAGRLDPEDVAAPRDDRPVNLEANEDAAGGSKLIAKTPDGTRVATPTLSSTSAATSARPAPAPKSRSSYAAALKAEPTDFHLEFSLAGRAVGLDTTIFGAVHRHESEQPLASRRNFWHSIYDIKYRKVEGKARPDEDDGNALEARGRREGSIFSHMPASIPAQSQQAKILQLLSVFRQLSADYGDTVQPQGAGLADTAFVNSKLTAKLNRQLEEPMIVASACLPDWAVDLAQSFPFLFPFDTRFTFLQSTSFGYARLMQRWIGQTRNDTSRRDENLGFLGRLQRQKVRISRDRILESAFKVFELYGSSRASLEVEFFDEVGSGLGPTLEFYALVSREFARKSLDLWRQDDHTDESEYVHATTGLFPQPIDDLESEKGKKVLKVFRVLGQFVAKSMMDSRIIDVNFSRIFMRLVLEQELPLTVASVKLIDPVLGKSLAHLQEYVKAKESIEADDKQSAAERASAVKAIEVRGATVSDLSLDFTLPGTTIELNEGGKDVSVDIENVAEYVDLVVDWTLRRGIEAQVLAFKQGFSTVFPVRDLQTFTPAEMVLLSGSIDGEDWSVNALVSAAKADHGFTMDSRVVQDLFSVMADFDPTERRAWLSFTTGAQRLPIGGFASLKPPLTIVRKDGGDRALPSCMTCTNYVKLPDYSTREILQTKIKFAVREGAAGFHLS